MKKAALLSVSDRTGLVELARALSNCGFELLTTSGTSTYLKENGISTSSIEAYTGQKEILDGRVKTLHPKIHAGLLAKRDNPEHLKQLESEGILSIDVAVVNLYPFVQGLNTDAAKDPKRMIELVDIGGPTMIRAAAKNFLSVLPLIDPKDYSKVIEILKTSNSTSVDFPLEFRKKLASKVFAWLANYNLEIAKYFSEVAVEDNKLKPSESSFISSVTGLVLEEQQELRYGENPHQKASMYKSFAQAGNPWKQYQGKALSYNNLLDADAAFRLIRTFDSQNATATILKHLNPCGLATAATMEEALNKSKRGDPRSHFGGVLAFNQSVSAAVAESIAEDFAEIVIAPGYDSKALEVLSRKKNLRVLEVNLADRVAFDIRSVYGAVLVQEADQQPSKVSEAELVTDRKPSTQELSDLELAWKVCAHVKSNAITIAKDNMLLASGAGQMSRIDSLEVALFKCKTHKHDLNGAVAASDAFFPFPDCLELLSAQGVKTVIAPSGSIKDAEVISTAKRLDISLFFARDRHFKH